MKVLHVLDVLCKDYPLDSQKNSEDPMLCAKLYVPHRKESLYLVGYDRSTGIALGFIRGSGQAGFGYFSVLALIDDSVAKSSHARLDVKFKPKRASVIKLTR